MTNIKSTKRALGSSVLALFLCFAMLLGTTFAWFTDTVTSANNVITAGNLDVELEYKKVVDNVTDTNWTTVADGALFNDTTIWEPGHVEVVYLKVSNVGTLDLKYQLNINVADFRVGFNADGDEIDLRDHLVFKVVKIDETAVGTYTRENAVNADADEIGLKDYNGETTTLESKDVDYVALIVYMPETVGNEANYRGNADTAPMINLGVNLFATQVAAEEDSFGPDYDEDAPIVSPSVTLPTTPATKPIELNASAESADENVSVKLPTSVVDSLPDEVKEISLSVSKPVIEGNAIKFDSIEIVDQDGEIVELSELNLTDKITVTLPEQTMFAPNEVVEIYHDGEFITIATVDANGAISYDVAHLCEVTVGEFEKPEETIDSVTIETLAQLLHFVEGNYGKKTGVLAADITVAESLVIPEDVTLKIDLNGKTITGAINKDKGAIIVNEGNLSIANGTVANTAENGDAVIENKGTMIVDDVTVNGAPMTSESYPEYAIISTGNLVVEDGTVVVSDRGTLRIEGGKTVINGGKFVATDAAGDRVITMHTIYANGGTLTIYDGIFQNNYKGASGSSVICPAGSTIDIYGGSFTDGNADESNFNNTANIQNYMGYGIPVNVYGGTFDDSSVNKNIAKDHKVTKVGDVYIVTLNTTNVVTNADELKAALAAGQNVLFANDITVAASEGGYSKAGIVVNKGQIVDGNGYTLTVTGAGDTWGCAIYLTKGTIKNITVAGAFRGVFTAGQSADLYLDNVTFKDVVYTFNSDGGNKNYGVYISNSTLNGWTSHSDVHKEVVYTNCNFGEGNGNAFCRPYGPTKFENCTFSAGYTVDTTQTTEITFDNCTWVVTNATQLAAAVKDGKTNLYLADGEYDVYGCGGKTLTINGTKNAVIKIMNEGEYGCDYGFDGSNVVFNGVTIDTTANNGNYKGFARMTATFNDCAFVGAYTTHMVQTFNDCTFDFKNGYLWIWGAKEVTFNECTFGGNSKNILAHGSASTIITINNCDFAATEVGKTGAGDPTAAIEIDPVGSNTYTINFTGENTLSKYYAGWTRVKDDSAGHTITGLN